MTQLRIAYAGCEAGIVRKLNLMADLLRGRGFIPSLKRWEGAGVDLVVACHQDGFGKRVADIATRRRIPLLIVDAPASSIPSGSRSVSRNLPVVEYFRMAEQLLGSKAGSEAGQDSVTLKQLDKAKDQCLSVGNALVFVDGESGSCRAASHSDLATITHHLIHQRPVRVLPKSSRPAADTLEVSVSLENFIFNALISKESVIWQDNHSVTLSEWPDINNNRYGSDIARLSATLLGRAALPEDLSGLASDQVVAAFLHACHVAGMLTSDSTREPDNPVEEAQDHSKNTGVFAALRRWLKV